MKYTVYGLAWAAFGAFMIAIDAERYPEATAFGSLALLDISFLKWG